MINSVAEIVQALLVVNGVVGDPEDTSLSWPAYIGYIPDKQGDKPVPANAVSLTDTQGTKDGRLMTGKTIKHPGFQVRVRSGDQALGRAKAEEIAEFLEIVTGVQVVLGSNSYVIQNLSQNADVLYMGREPTNEQRANHSVNYLSTIYPGATSSHGPIVPVPGVPAGFANVIYVTADTVLVTEDSGAFYSNRDATADLTLTLPDDYEVGQTYVASVDAAHMLTVLPAAGQVIQVGERATIPGGFVRSDQVGADSQFLRISTTSWKRVAGQGNWEVEDA